MATLDDMASDREALFLEVALKAREESAKGQIVTPTGACLFCGETELPHPDARYCCHECQVDHEYQTKARRIAGRA